LSGFGLGQAHIPYILACLLQIDPDSVQAYHFDADLDSESARLFDVDPDLVPAFQFDANPC
jgi:hypothetical protein